MIWIEFDSSLLILTTFIELRKNEWSTSCCVLCKSICTTTTPSHRKWHLRRPCFCVRKSAASTTSIDCYKIAMFDLNCKSRAAEKHAHKIWRRSPFVWVMIDRVVCLTYLYIASWILLRNSRIYMYIYIRHARVPLFIHCMKLNSTHIFCRKIFMYHLSLV